MNVVIWWSVVSHGVAKYINDIHGNTVVQDRSSGFHVFKLHGYSVGVTSLIFMGVALLICATFPALKLGLGRLLQCCCGNCMEAEHITQPQTAAQPTQAVPMPSMQMTRRDSVSSKSPGTFTVELIAVVTDFRERLCPLYQTQTLSL